MAARRAHATPTKDFFVRIITKDISLEDCILDLVDNCLDGARKVKYALDGNARVDDYSGFVAQVEFGNDRFHIDDNCGGIKISEAIDYAFHFGRRANAPTDGDYSIGLYGIGMKRAIFKMGNLIDIYSSTATEAFSAHIDVNEWLGRAPVRQPDGTLIEDWDFDLADAALIPGSGTKIDISVLHEGVIAEFSNPTFANSLARILGREYAQFLAKGFEILVNGRRIPGFDFTVRESADFKPIRIQYADESGVEVDIIAGMAGVPPEDLEPLDRRSEPDNWGWFVLCNDRVVVAADKSDQTVWGDDGFPNWHYQYNGFIGVISFHAKNANLLPWKTTKRDVDPTNGAYHRAISKMKDATRAWIDYTNNRRLDLDEAKRKEAAATAKPLFEVAPSATLQVPRVVDTAPRIETRVISYRKPLTELVKAKKLLGNANMPNTEVGSKTFDYYIENESGD